MIYLDECSYGRDRLAAAAGWPLAPRHDRATRIDPTSHERGPTESELSRLAELLAFESEFIGAARQLPNAALPVANASGG
jgi:hypothetical protein